MAAEKHHTNSKYFDTTKRSSKFQKRSEALGSKAKTKKLSDQEKLNFILKKETERLFNDSKQIDFAYEIFNFLEMVPTPCQFIETYGRVVRSNVDGERKWVIYSDSNLLKLAFYLVMEYLLDRFPNSPELNAEIGIKIITGDDLMRIRHRDNKDANDSMRRLFQRQIDTGLPVVGQVWNKVPSESQELIAGIFTELVNSIKSYHNLEELFRIAFQQPTKRVHRLLLEFYDKLIAVHQVKELSIVQDDIADIIGSYLINP